MGRPTCLPRRIHRSKRPPRPPARLLPGRRLTTVVAAKRRRRRHGQCEAGRALGIRRWRWALFPELLGTYGDRGNALCSLRASSGAASPGASWRSPPTTDAASLDCYLLGGGEDHAEIVALTGSSDHRSRTRRQRGAAVFGVCGGPAASRHSPRAGRRFTRRSPLLDAHRAGPTRCVGEVVIESSDALLGAIAGFENH